MYRHIKRDKLTEAEQAYLENHVFITSALYGVVPALSPISLTFVDMLSYYCNNRFTFDIWDELETSPEI